MTDLRDRITKAFQKRVGNPLTRRLPTQALLETTGRKSRQPRRTPLGGSRVGDPFWFVSEFGEKSQYVQNIKANPNVRVRLGGRWHNGTAHLAPDDDPRNGCAHCRSSTVSPSAPWARTCSRSGST